MVRLLELSAGLCLGYAIATLAESFLHKHIGHASPKLRKFWQRHPLFFQSFSKAFYGHHVVHHGLTFPDFVTQFREPVESSKASVDANILEEAQNHFHDPKLPAWIEASEYGLSVSTRAVPYFVGPVVPLVPVIYLIFGLWVTLGAIIPLLIVYPLMSKSFHPLLHLYPKVMQKGPLYQRRLLNLRVVRKILVAHYLHHKYVMCNFNLIPGGDWILGAIRKPSPKDRETMKKLGLPVD